MYELMVVLKINFYKSEVLTINNEENWVAAEIFQLSSWNFSIKYLEVPVSHNRLNVSDWLPLTEKLLKS